MPQAMIDALSYPRRLVLEVLSKRDCPHGHGFDDSSVRCTDCDLGPECRWLDHLNDFADFQARPHQEISESLRFGIRFVRQLHEKQCHDADSCDCGTCGWLRYTESLVDEPELAAVS